MQKLINSLRDNLAISITIGLITLLFLLISHFGLLANWENIVSDTLFIQSDPPPQLAIAAIDEQSLSKYGAWPWSRQQLGEIIQEISEQGARVIALDITLFESREGDEQLQNAISSSPAEIVLAGKFEDFELLSSHLEANTGFVNLEPDTDGKVRNVDLVRYDNSNTAVPSFAYISLLSYFGSDFSEQNIPPTTIGFSNIESSEQSINYFGPAATVPTFSIADITSSDFGENVFADKIVFVGSTVQDLKQNLDDRFITPFGLLPGVEIHAQTVGMILTNSTITESSPTMNYGIIMLVGILMLLVLVSTNLLRFSLFSVATLALYSLAAVFLFGINLRIDFLYTPIFIILVWIIGVVWQYFSHKQQNEYLRKAFVQYVNSGLLSQLMQEPDQLKLGGERRNMSVMFSDIRGFTSISEKIDPEELVHFLNEYLTSATDTIFKHQGTVDKYLGDAIMALWNAPLLDDKHAENACLASLEIIDVLDQFNQNTEDDIPELKIGIGVNTGEMVVGNMGSERRFDYTVMGDNVNLASRLEGLTKQYKVAIILGEGTIQRLAEEQPNNEFFIRQLDRVTVKGKESPINIYQLIHPQDFADPVALISGYEKALQAYLEGKFTKATKLFKKVASTHSDPTAKLMAERCSELKNSTENWPGYWKWDVK